MPISQDGLAHPIRRSFPTQTHSTCIGELIWKRILALVMVVIAVSLKDLLLLNLKLCSVSA